MPDISRLSVKYKQQPKNNKSSWIDISDYIIYIGHSARSASLLLYNLNNSSLAETQRRKSLFLIYLTKVRKKF